MIIGLVIFTLLGIFFALSARHLTRPADVTVDALTGDGCLGLVCYALSVICFMIDLMFLIFRGRG